MSSTELPNEKIKKALDAIVRYTPSEDVGDWKKSKKVRPTIARGASDKALAKVEKKLRCKLPADYRDFLRLSDGVRWYQETFDLFSTSQLLSGGRGKEAAKLFQKYEKKSLPAGLLIGFNPLNAQVLMFNGTPRGNSKPNGLLFGRPPFRKFSSFGAFLEKRAKEVLGDRTEMPEGVYEKIRTTYSQEATRFEFQLRGKPSFQETRLLGAPAWPAAKPWPACLRCKTPLNFRAQIVAKDFPAPMRPTSGNALFIFVCQNDNHPYSLKNADSIELRFEKPVDPSRAAKPPEPPSDRPAGYALKIETLQDFKGSLYLTKTDLVPIAREQGMDLELLVKKVYEAISPESDDFPWKPNEDLKIGGFPAWMQNPQKAVCKRCKKDMPLYLQTGYRIDNHLFYIFRCPCSPSDFVTRWDTD